MKNNTLFIGKVLIEPEEVDSTNRYAAQLLQNSRPVEGTAISAAYQNAGKGQYGNSWFSDKGKNLLASTILYPAFLKADRQFQLNKAVSLAVKEAVEAFLGTPVYIKWPNDIFVNDKKVAGILIEIFLRNSHLSASITGTGINVNQEHFPKNIPHASSFVKETGREWDIKAVLQQLFAQLEKRYLQLKAGKHDLLNQDYLQALYRYQEYHEYNANGRIITGQILGVTPQGKLIIETQGRLSYFDFKEIRYQL